MANLMEKPFVYGTAVFGDNFADRVKETRRLKMNFEAGVNTILISPRRTGKTSLVYRAMEQVSNPDIKFVNMDIYDCRDEYEFYEKFASSVLMSLASKMDQVMDIAKTFLSRLAPKITFSSDPMSEISLSLGIGPSTPNPEEVLNLPEIIAQKRGIHIVVCIDEFQQVGEFDNTLHVQKKARGIWQLQKRVSYCLFGSKKHMMENIFTKKSMPFYQFGDMVLLLPIPNEEWIPYITSRFSFRGMKISPSLAGVICDRVERYSSYVQQLAWNVMIEAEGEVRKEDVENGYEMLILQNAPYFMQQIAGLTSYQMNYIKALASGIHSGFSSHAVMAEYRMGSKSNISKIEKVLLSKELITKEKGRTDFADPVFPVWFRKEYGF